MIWIVPCFVKGVAVTHSMFKLPLSNNPELLTTRCDTESLFIQETVVPFCTVIVAGLKVLLWITTVLAFMEVHPETATTPKIPKTAKTRYLFSNNIPTPRYIMGYETIKTAMCKGYHILFLGAIT